MSDVSARLPAPVHRAALRIAHRLRKFWWGIARPNIRGVCLIALDDAGRVLLVRHSYQKRGAWCLPSGGIPRGKPALEIAAKELREEAGLCAASMRVVGHDSYRLHGALNHVTIVEVETTGTVRPDQREIEEAAFFAPDDLPHPLNGAVPRTLRIWRKGSEQV